MKGPPVRGRRSSGLLRSSSQSLIPSAGPKEREQARKVRAVNRRVALDQLSATDREIVAVLSEHRVATTQQISTLLELPERTARYRLDRLWKLGMCGGRQPYADQGSAPYHWWPSRLADAFHRGRELPRGGEREEPQEQFLRHAAAITGLYVALVRLAPSLGWELLAFQREVEARQEFTLRDRQAAIVPDAFVLIREGDAAYHAMVEIDRGTMSIPRLSRKLSLYLTPYLRVRLMTDDVSLTIQHRRAPFGLIPLWRTRTRIALAELASADVWRPQCLVGAALRRNVGLPGGRLRRGEDRARCASGLRGAPRVRPRQSDPHRTHRRTSPAVPALSRVRVRRFAHARGRAQAAGGAPRTRTQDGCGECEVRARGGCWGPEGGEHHVMAPVERAERKRVAALSSDRRAATAVGILYIVGDLAASRA
jgi:DNA-binding Lrp family transcriptional regulator